MLGRLLTGLYFHLLKLYPDRFLDEFGEEMSDVFAQALSGLDDSGTPPATRRLKMVRLFFREVWYFPLAYLDARRYQASLGDGETPAGTASYGEGEVTETWVGRRAPWGAALVGALPFLLYGLAHLLEGFAELGGHNSLAFNLLDGSPNRPAILLTLPMGVYFVSALGLLFGVLKGFPRWSYAYLGMSLYFGWSYNNQNYYGLFYKWWVWLPLLAAVVLGLLLTRSLKPLARLLQGAWNDWTRLSFTLYAFAAPMTTVVFFDMDWGAIQLYGLIFDTVLLAAVAVAFLRSRTILGRVLSLEAAVLILVVKWLLGGGYPSFDEPLRVLYFWFLFIIICFGILLLPAVIGLLRRGVHALSSR
jgi:hypothetical protein